MRFSEVVWQWLIQETNINAGKFTLHEGEGEMRNSRIRGGLYDYNLYDRQSQYRPGGARRVPGSYVPQIS